MMRNFLRDEQGQDLIEYTLLLAFVALASAALFISAGTSVSRIWERPKSVDQGRRVGGNCRGATSWWMFSGAWLRHAPAFLPEWQGGRTGA